MGLGVCVRCSRAWYGYGFGKGRTWRGGGGKGGVWGIWDGRDAGRGGGEGSARVREGCNDFYELGFNRVILARIEWNLDCIELC